MLRKFFSVTYLSMLLLVMLVAVVVAGFVLVLKAQTSEVLGNREFTRCVLVELGNHQGRFEDVFNAISKDDQDALAEVLSHPPEESPCLDRLIP